MNNDVALVLTKWISMQCSPKPKFNRPEQKKHKILSSCERHSVNESGRWVSF